MIDRIPMTQSGYNRIKAEVERLEQEEMPKIAQRIATAREEGDLKENAEYHGARESQGMLQAKINQMKDKLVRATIIDPNKVPRDEVAFGATRESPRSGLRRRRRVYLCRCRRRRLRQRQIPLHQPYW